MFFPGNVGTSGSVQGLTVLVKDVSVCSQVLLQNTAQAAQREQPKLEVSLLKLLKLKLTA